MTWVLTLFVVGLVLLVVEMLALRDGRDGTTLSAHVWRWRLQPVFRAVAGGALAWVLHHLANPWDVATGGWDDWAAIAIGAVVGLLIRYRPRSGM